MASKIKGINIKIGADTKGLDTALNEISRKGKESKTELNEINRAIKKSPESLELWRQKQEVLTKVIDESRKKVEFLEEAQKQVSEQFKNNEIGEETYRAFMREVEKAKSEVSNFEGELKKASESADDLGNTSEIAGEKAEKSSDGFTVMKGVLADLAAEGIKKAVDGLKEFSENAMAFEDSMAKVSTIADATVPIEELQDSIIELSNQTGIEAKEISENVYNAISAGQKTGDAVNFVGNAIKLAKSGFAETGNALDILSTIMNAYGMEASEVTRVSDVLIQTQNLGKTTVAELSSSMGKVIPTAKAYSVELEQLAAGYAIMTANGVATAESTTYMNSMLNELGKSGTTVSDILKDETGMSFKELSESGTSLSDVLSIINDAASDQGKQFSDMWSSAEAGKAGLILLGDSAQDFNGTLEQMANAAGATETAFEKLDTKSYELQKTQNELKNVGIKLGSDVLNAITPLAEKTLPKVEKFAENLADNAPKIIDKAEDMLPLITGIGTAFVAWKASTTAITALSGAVSLADATTKLLNSTMLANPAVAITTAVVGLTGAIIAYKLAQEDELTIAEQVSEKYAAAHDAINDTHTAIDKLKGSFNDNAETIRLQSERTEDLWKELDNLTSATGRVKDADKERAEYILNELNNALGTEYTMTGNQIGKYQELAGEIENVIEKKKAEAYLDEYLAMSSDMAKNKNDALKEYQEAYRNSVDAEEQLSEAEKNFSDIYSGEMTAQQIVDEYGKKGQKFYISEEVHEAAVAVVQSNAHLNDAKARMTTSKAAYEAANDALLKLDEAETAFAEKRYDDVEKILYTQKSADQEMLESAEEYTEEAATAYKNAMNDAVAETKLAIDSASQKAIDKALETMGETVRLGKRAGVEASDLFTDEMKAEINKMLDEGYDISGLAKWAKTSGVKVSEVFGDEYTKIVQEQLDKGYDVADLLQWGAASGKKLEEEFDKEFFEKFQNNLDIGFDTTELFNWANKNSIALGELFGENFGSYVSSYLNQKLYEDNPILSHTSNVNSAWDAQLRREGRYATGGYIPIGARGIVADAGPELIEIMNGGVNVTPLSGNSMNTQVSSGSVTKNFYNTYNFNEPKMTSDYDIRKIAQQMAAEQKSIELGRGQ